jgi:anti-sigma-K factor RskA
MTGPQDPDNPAGPADEALQAAEYALRLMDPAEVPDFEARLAVDPALRRLVTDWEQGLAPLAETVEAVVPPERAKARLMATVEPDRASSRADVSARGARRTPWFGWFGGLALAGAVAVALIAVLPEVRFAPAPSPAQATFAAEIAAEDGSLVIRAALSGATLAVERLSGAAPADRVLELWLIAVGADAPISLGVLPDDASTVLTVPDDLASAFAGGVLAVSEEPVGGSPTGTPTGAVLAVGSITTL